MVKPIVVVNNFGNNFGLTVWKIFSTVVAINRAVFGMETKTVIQNSDSYFSGYETVNPEVLS